MTLHQITIKRSLLVNPPDEFSSIALELINDFKEIKTALDIGTGTGYIAIGLAKRKIDTCATDICKRALSLAMLNATMNRVNINVFYSDLFSEVRGKFDLIIFNTPLITDVATFKIILKNSLLRSKFITNLLIHRFEFKQGWAQRERLMRTFLKNAKDHLLKNGTIITQLTSDEIKSLDSELKSFTFLTKNMFQKTKTTNNFIVVLQKRNAGN